MVFLLLGFYLFGSRASFVFIVVNAFLFDALSNFRFVKLWIGMINVLFVPVYMMASDLWFLQNWCSIARFCLFSNYLVKGWSRARLAHFACYDQCDWLGSGFKFLSLALGYPEIRFWCKSPLSYGRASSSEFKMFDFYYSRIFIVFFFPVLSNISHLSRFSLPFLPIFPKWHARLLRWLVVKKH